MKKLLVMSALTVVAAVPFLSFAAKAGPTSGYVAKQDTAKVGKTNTYTLQFNGDEDAVVDLDTKGDTHLSIRITNAKGKVVTQSKAMENPRCQWSPKNTDVFTITISSTSDKDVPYSLDAW